MSKPLSRCPVCGVSMPVSELPAHGRAAHPDIVSTLKKAKRDYSVRVAIVAVPAFVLWFGIWVAAMSYNWLLGWPAWAVLAYVLGGLLLIPLATYAYAVRAYRADLRRSADRPHPCGFCGRDLASSDEQEQHMQAAHPEVRRLTRFGRRVERTTDLVLVLGVVAFVAAFMEGWIPVVLFVVGLVLLICVLFLASFWVRTSVSRKVLAMRR